MNTDDPQLIFINRREVRLLWREDMEIEGHHLGTADHLHLETGNAIPAIFKKNIHVQYLFCLSHVIHAALNYVLFIPGREGSGQGQEIEKKGIDQGLLQVRFTAKLIHQYIIFIYGLALQLL